MNLDDMLKKLHRRSKSDDIPGTVEAYLDRLCPNCGRQLKQMKPCCGSPNGYIACRGMCGYREEIEVAGGGYKEVVS